MKKLSFGVIILIAMCASCALEDVDGDKCPPNGEVGEIKFIGDVSCTADSCEKHPSYLNNFKIGYCPTDYAKCAASSDNQWYCAAIACKKDQHVSGEGVCVDDTIEKCGSDTINCKELMTGWKEIECEVGRCVVKECLDDYYLKNDICEAKDVTIDCPAGTYLDSGICEINSRENCGRKGNNCEDMPGWKDGDCSSSGDCLATECTEKYELKGGKCIAKDSNCDVGLHWNPENSECEEDSVNACGKPGFDCASENAGWVDGSCSHGQCVATSCEATYQLNDKGKCEAKDNSCASGLHWNPNVGECEEDSIESCGEFERRCQSLVNAWKDGACVNASCEVSSCEDGYHLYMNACEMDDINNCGSHGQICSIAGGAPKCVNGHCELSTCNSGQHEYNGGCETDSNQHCGGHGIDCSIPNGTASCSGGSCVVNGCDGGSHMYNNSCEDDSVTNCGSHGNKCSVSNGTPKCEGGSCGIDSCSAPKYHYYPGGNICEQNTTSNCGEHGKVCSIKNGSADCSSGVCVTKCNDTTTQTYHIYDNGCEADSNTNCGEHGKTCSSSNILNSSTVSCKTGKCTALTCKSGYSVTSTGICKKDSFCSENMYECNGDSCCSKPNCAGSCMMIM